MCISSMCVISGCSTGHQVANAYTGLFTNAVSGAARWVRVISSMCISGEFNTVHQLADAYVFTDAVIGAALF